MILLEVIKSLCCHQTMHRAVLSSHLFDIFLMLKTTIKIAYLCPHAYCVDIGKANHVFYNLESMIQKWKVGPKFSEGDHIFRKNWSVGTIFTGTNIPVTSPLHGARFNPLSAKK